MSLLGRMARRIGRGSSWLIRPATDEVRRNWNGWREGLSLLKQIPPIDIIAPEARPLALSPPGALEAMRRRTKRTGRLYAVMLVLNLLWWTRETLFAPHTHLIIGTVNSLAIALLLTSQYVTQCFLNWQARTERAQSFTAFLGDARQFWPR